MQRHNDEETNKHCILNSKDTRICFLFSLIAGLIYILINNFILLSVIASSLLGVCLLVNRKKFKLYFFFIFLYSLVGILFLLFLYFIIRLQIVFGILNIIFIISGSVIISESVFRLKSRSFTIITLALLFLLLILTKEVIYYKEILLNVFQKPISAVSSSISENIISTLKSQDIWNELITRLSTDDNSLRSIISNAVKIVIVLSPALFYNLTLLCSWAGTAAFRVIIMRSELGKKRLRNWLISVSTTSSLIYLVSSLVFILSFIASRIFDFSTLSVIAISFCFIMLISAPGSVYVGSKSLLPRLRRNPGYIIFVILLLLAQCCCNPLIVYMYLAFLGTVTIIGSYLINKYGPHNFNNQ